MSSQALSSPVPASPSLAALAFRWVFTVGAIFAPMLLIVYAFAVSSDAIERAQIILQGLESTVLVLVASLSLGAYYAFAVNSDPVHLLADSNSLRRTASA
jgi:hypothetical protein